MDARYVSTLECPTPFLPRFFSRDRRTTAARTLARSDAGWPLVVVPPDLRLRPACVLTVWRATGLGLGLTLTLGLDVLLWLPLCCWGSAAMVLGSKRAVTR